MKIAIFCHDAYLSGSNRSLIDWVNADTEDDFFIVLPRITRTFSEQLKNKNVTLISGNYFCVYKNLNKMPFKYLMKKFIKKTYMFFCKKFIKNNIRNRLEKEGIESIISNSFAIYLGAEISKSMHVEHFWHIREFMELDHKISHYNENKIKLLCEYSNAIFISDPIEDYYKSKYKFKKEIKIYNQIYIDEYFNEKKDLFQNDRISIIMSGILQENKGQKEAIFAAIKLLSNNIPLQLDLYGDGPQRKELSEVIQKSGYSDYINLKGYANNLNEIRNKYDIALICSSNEALGRVTVESMGSGCITIGADAGCTSKIIKNNYNGFLYELHNIDDLVNKILYVYNNKYEMEGIRINARKYVEQNFSKPIYMKITKYIEQCKH